MFGYSDYEIHFNHVGADTDINICGYMKRLTEDYDFTVPTDATNGDIIN